MRLSIVLIDKDKYFIEKSKKVLYFFYERNVEKIFFEKKCFFLCTYPYCGLTLRINNLFKEII